MPRSKTILIIIILSIASCLRGYTQNLVYNGSFELYDTCPNSMGQIYYADNWFQPYAVDGNLIALSSSDYFNSCSSIVSVPQNSQGHQIPLTGNAYAGVAFSILGADDYREYIETKLVTTLKKNYIYCVEFYVSLADTAKFSVNRMGGYFSNDSIILDHTIFTTPPFLLSYTPQIENDSSVILNDKTNWTKISGSFLAQGGEQYITIGNFYDSASTTAHAESGFASYAYYYIDDVSIIACDSINNDTASSLFIPNVFTPNSDGKNDVFKFEGQNISEFHALIFNRWGELLYEWSDINGSWDGYYKGKIVSDGVYVYEVKAKGIDGVEHNKHGAISVVK